MLAYINNTFNGDTFPVASCASGPSGESFPEAGVHAGDVWQEESQPQEASS